MVKISILRSSKYRMLVDGCWFVIEGTLICVICVLMTCDDVCFQEVVGQCVDNCLLVKRTDFLFGRLYDRFSADAIAKAMYLESLEPYILNDTLTSITPIVMKDFVDHYEQRAALTAIEACIVHMDVASLDIHQVTGQ